MNKYDGTLGFEIELNITDQDGNIMNRLGKDIVSKEIIKILKLDKKYQKMMSKAGGQIVKPELDASQIEIYNRIPNVSLQCLQDELCAVFELVEGAADQVGLCISKLVVPPQNFSPIPSKDDGHYMKIHDLLMSVSKECRKATNVTGTHMTYEAGKGMCNHIAVSQYVRDALLSRMYNKIGASEGRINSYNKVVDALNKLGMVSVGSVPQNILNEEDVRQMQMTGDVDRFSYELVRKKTGKDSFRNPVHLSELRTIDGPVSVNDIMEKTTFAYNLLQQAIHENNG